MIYTDGMHIAATTLKELHEAAKKIGATEFNDGKRKSYSLTTPEQVIEAKKIARRVETIELAEIAASTKQ